MPHSRYFRVSKGLVASCFCHSFTDNTCYDATAETLYFTQKVDRLLFNSGANSANVASGDRQTRH